MKVQERATNRQEIRQPNRRPKFAKVPLEVLQLQLRDPERRVLIALHAFSYNDDGLAYPSVATLAEVCALSKRTVQRVLRRLEELELVTCIERGTGRGLTNVFQVKKGDLESDTLSRQKRVTERDEKGDSSRSQKGDSSRPPEEIMKREEDIYTLPKLEKRKRRFSGEMSRDTAGSDQQSSDVGACRRCGAPLRRRERKADGAAFLACSRYPACSYTVDLETAAAPGPPADVGPCDKCHRLLPTAELEVYAEKEAGNGRTTRWYWCASCREKETEECDRCRLRVPPAELEVCTAFGETKFRWCRQCRENQKKKAG